MTLLQTTLRLRRVPLAQAVRSLAAEDLRVAIHLVLAACPATSRSWTTSTRIAEDLSMSIVRVDQALRRLVDGGFISPWSERGALRCFEFGSLLPRADVPPENLPLGAPSP